MVFYLLSRHRLKVVTDSGSDAEFLEFCGLIFDYDFAHWAACRASLQARADERP